MILYYLILLNSLHFLKMLLWISKPSSCRAWSDGSVIWITKSSWGILSVYDILIKILLYLIILIIWFKLRNILGLNFELIFYIINIIIQIFQFITCIIMIMCILILFNIGALILWVSFSIKVSSMILRTAIFTIHLRIIRSR